MITGKIEENEVIEQSRIKIIEQELDKLYKSVGNLGETETGNNIADKLLVECKNVAHQYLADKETVQDLDDEDLLLLFEFLMLKHNHLAEIKNNLNINEYNEWGFTELGESLDLYTDTGTLTTKFQEVLYIKMAKDINFVTEQIQFCYSILNCMIKERNIFNQ